MPAAQDQPFGEDNRTDCLPQTAISATSPKKATVALLYPFSICLFLLRQCRLLPTCTGQSNAYIIFCIARVSFSDQYAGRLIIIKFRARQT